MIMNETLLIDLSFLHIIIQFAQYQQQIIYINVYISKFLAF